MAERAGSSSQTDTQTVTLEEVNSLQDVRSIKLTLKKPKTEKQVKWTEGTVDNEHLNRKKSKCCCIYEKPRKFGDSSSESDDECENCFGHVERKKKKNLTGRGEGSDEIPIEEDGLPSGEESPTHST